MVGFGANRRGGRLPSLILIGLMVLIVVLSYNYWSVSRQHGRVLDELAEAQAQVKRTDAARNRLERRNSELITQVDTHRRQIDQKDGDYSILEGKLQARDALNKKCSEEKLKLQSDVTFQSTETTRLKEQMKGLKQEIVRQEEQLKELKKNNTNLERKMEYESMQCGRQIAQLKEEYEESRKSMEQKAAKYNQDKADSNKDAAAASQTQHGTVAAKERRPQASQQHDGQDLKDEMVKPGSDAGMPGIEDSEVGKVDEMHFGLKKPVITQNRVEPKADGVLLKDEQNVVEDELGVGAGVGMKEGAGAGVDAGPRPEVGFIPEPGADAVVENGARQEAGIGNGGGEGAGFDAPPGLPPDLPDLPQDGGAGMVQNPVPVQQQVPQPVVDRPVVMDEDNKAAVQVDEFGEQRRQQRGPDDQGAALPPPPNPAQVLPNPIEPQRDPVPAAPLRHRQNDEDRELPGDRAVDYGKRHQAIDIL
ncbi:protein GOLM2 isoform X2 [Trichomycterus rosablanca]|uniref:protein GOLM2 isoform X2 n=1 Tax=Trichomycterus rosablanca TaxID=2290929 RepID=UPI002F35629A